MSASTSSSSFSALLAAFMFGAIVASLFLLWRVGGIDAGTEAAKLRAHNDSVTVYVQKLLHERDSLLHSADSLVHVKDSALQVSDSLSRKIQVLAVRRKEIPAVIRQLPDTGVASRFRELIR